MAIRSDSVHTLLVDDDVAFVEFAVQMLEKVDDRITVIPATGTAEGLEELSEHDIDCVIADYDMGASDGIEFLKRVREEYGELPFILYTGKGSEDVAAEAISAGVTDYFRKWGDPEQFSMLAHRIRNAVRSHRSLQADQTLQGELKRSYERISDAFFSIDTEFRHTYVNENGAQLLGRDPADLRGTPIWNVFPELTSTPFEDALRTAIANQERTDVETHYPPADSWYDVSIYPDDDGVSIYFRPMDDRKRHEQVVTALHAVANDLTEMESVERICRRTIEATENLLDFDFSIIAIEDEGLLHPKAVSSEMAPDEYESMSIREGIAGETYRTGESFLIDDMATWDGIGIESPWRSAISLPVGDHGNFQAVDESVGAFDETDLQLAELLITHTSNHLDRIAAKQSLERKNERLNEFASIVSHDLRNPLNVATGRLELAAAECDSAHLENVERALTRMDLLIADLLSLARQGESISATETVPLQDIVRECWSNVDVERARIVNEATETIEADHERLCQLFENLFRNAIDHVGADVTVTVGEHETGFFVEDDGSGIDPDAQDAVFESGYTTKEEGTGFGLSIVREIVNAHGWRIRVTEGADGGARFVITGVEFATR